VVATASCRAGSNTAPASSRRGKPRLVSTPRACCRTAWIPSTIERALEVVDDRQPLPGDLGAAVSLGAFHLGGTPLAQIVQVSQGAQLLVLGLGEPSLQTRKPGVQIGEPGLQVGHGGAAAWAACAAAAIGPSGTVRASIGRAGLGTGVMLDLGRLAAASPGLPPAGRVTHWG
jgi:hypothetical protein